MLEQYPVPPLPNDEWMKQDSAQQNLGYTFPVFRPALPELNQITEAVL